MRIEPEISAVSLVLLGSFNPSIFTPAWFGWHDLLSKRTVDTAELQTAQAQITAFRADWLELQVVQGRFSLSTTQSPFVRLQDMAIRIFREQLPHTPLNAVGINREIHFLVNTFSERDRIGRKLAPTGPWGDWGRQLEPDGRQGGMTSITMTQVNLPDRPAGGRLNVTVQPSNRIGDGERGVYVQVNDHYEAEEPDNRIVTGDVISMLEKNFDSSVRHSERIIDHVMSLREE